MEPIHVVQEPAVLTLDGIRRQPDELERMRARGNQFIETIDREGVHSRHVEYLLIGGYAVGS